MADARIVRKFRHWKQRFNPDAKFIFRRGVLFGPKRYDRGDLCPEELLRNKLKLRNFWEARVIELAEFEVPDIITGQRPSIPPGVTVEGPNKGGWFSMTLQDGSVEKIRGKEGVDERLVEIWADIDVSKAPRIEKKGGGWYAITTPGSEPDNVRGKDELDERLTEIKAETKSGDWYVVVNEDGEEEPVQGKEALDERLTEEDGTDG